MNEHKHENPEVRSAERDVHQSLNRFENAIGLLHQSIGSEKVRIENKVEGKVSEVRHGLEEKVTDFEGTVEQNVAVVGESVKENVSGFTARADDVFDKAEQVISSVQQAIVQPRNLLDQVIDEKIKYAENYVATKREEVEQLVLKKRDEYQQHLIETGSTLRQAAIDRVRTTMDDMDQLGQQFVERARSQIQTLQGDVDAFGQNFVERARGHIQGIQGELQTTLDSTMRALDSKPFTTMITMLSVGVFLGMVLGRRGVKGFRQLPAPEGAVDTGRVLHVRSRPARAA